MEHAHRVIRSMLLSSLCFSALTRLSSEIPGAEQTAITASPAQAKPPAAGDRLARPTALRERFFTGAVSGDRFGYAVAQAGDVNSDGYTDVIVGAPFSDAAETDGGCAYVYLGGPTIRTTPDVILPGLDLGERFGTSVAGAGDINGDGCDDIIVGAPYGTAAGGTGVARVFYGDRLRGVDPAGITLRGVRPGEEFGFTVAGAGDVNGDGWADVIVGAWNSNRRATAAGSAYVFYGGPALNTTADVVLLGSAAEDWLGYSAAGAGDVNGDGYADVVVGAHGSDAGGFNAGVAYILFGGDQMDNVPDVVLTGTSALGVFGVSVSGAGDVNGDGYADVVIGAERENLGGPDAGRAYVFYGGPAMDAVPDAGLIGGTPGDLFGHVATAAGDVNGDGYGDVLVTANWNDAGGLNAGRAFLYFGGSPMDELPDAIFTGAEAEDMFGQSAACAGDVNGDGLSDFIVGADYNNAGGYDAGRAYLYLNSLTGADIPDLVYTGNVAGDQLGYALDGAGDVNGDGYSDMIIGAWSKYSSGSAPGYAWVCFGGVDLSAARKITLTGEKIADHFGVAVTHAGDVNGDGYDDLIVGAAHYGQAGMGEGRAYLYLGGSDMDTIPDLKFSQPVSGSGFGTFVAAAGDVNGDGYADALIGALSPPVAYLYYGGTVMDNFADKFFAPPFAGSAAGAGDVNGDGYDDIVIGCPGDDLGGTHTGMGRAHVYFGGVRMDTTADMTMTGEADGDGFGASVAGAGDLNADGCADIAVGAPRNDAAGKDAGRVYVFCGGLQLRSTPDLVIPAGAAGEYFGYSTAGCGDVNADGYADIIVGASRNFTGGAYAGRAYVYFGGYWMDNVPDQTMTGTETIAEFGVAVAGAGDVNGDRMADLLVGAVNGGNTGSIGFDKAFLFISSGPPVVPRIMSVRDVPEDQGGSVWVRWVRSGYDLGSGGGIKSYIVERSAPPGVGGFAWETIATVEPNGNLSYLFTAPTWNDATEFSSGLTYFRVTATSHIPTEFWRSNIAAGWSTDNLAPLRPTGASLQPLPDGRMQLAWRENRTDPDVSRYVVYRSGVDGFSVADSTFLLSTQDTVVVDSSALRGRAYYYRVTCMDIHGNESAPTAQLNAVVAATGEDFSQVPRCYALEQNYPNPFNPTTVVSYQLPVASHVWLAVYDVLGREVATLVNGKKQPGIHKLKFDGSGLPSGVYFYRLEARPDDGPVGRARPRVDGAGGYTETKKLLLVR